MVHDLVYTGGPGEWNEDRMEIGLRRLIPDQNMPFDVIPLKVKQRRLVDFLSRTQSGEFASVAEHDNRLQQYAVCHTKDRTGIIRK